MGKCDGGLNSGPPFGGSPKINHITTMSVSMCVYVYTSDTNHDARNKKDDITSLTRDRIALKQLQSSHLESKIKDGRFQQKLSMQSSTKDSNLNLDCIF